MSAWMAPILHFLTVKGPQPGLRLLDGAPRVNTDYPLLNPTFEATAIIPHQPLSPGQTYTVRVEATVDGVTVTREWSFTTRS